MKIKAIAIILFISFSIFANSKNTLIWLSLKIPEPGIVFRSNTLLGLSTDLNLAINHNLFKLSLTYGEEFMIDPYRPALNLKEISGCYGYLWKWEYFYFDVCAGIGIEHGTFRGKDNPNALYASESFEYIAKTTAIFKGVFNLYYTWEHFAIGAFIEPFYIGPQSGFLAGFSLNWGVFK
jgi:hypothetical protein